MNRSFILVSLRGVAKKIAGYEMCISLAVQTTVALHLISDAICQFPMPFPFPQMGSPQQMGSPNMPPMPPQSFFPQTMNFPMQRKMPSVVMPYYTKSGKRPEKKFRRKKRKPKKYEESWEPDTDSEGEHSISGEQDFRRRAKKRRQVLTPVVSYVTKDGYVVYQKKIKKDKAKDWLEMSKKLKESTEATFTSAEEKQFQKMLKHKKKKRHQHHDHH